eukprot:scaffold1528_cov198-Pinguiococcus_pyrenoidosus.AAC.12
MEDECARWKEWRLDDAECRAPAAIRQPRETLRVPSGQSHVLSVFFLRTGLSALCCKVAVCGSSPWLANDFVPVRDVRPTQEAQRHHHSSSQKKSLTAFHITPFHITRLPFVPTHSSFYCAVLAPPTAGSAIALSISITIALRKGGRDAQLVRELLELLLKGSRDHFLRWMLLAGIRVDSYGVAISVRDHGDAQRSRSRTGGEGNELLDALLGEGTGFLRTRHIREDDGHAIHEQADDGHLQHHRHMRQEERVQKPEQRRLSKGVALQRLAGAVHVGDGLHDLAGLGRHEHRQHDAEVPQPGVGRAAAGVAEGHAGVDAVLGSLGAAHELGEGSAQDAQHDVVDGHLVLPALAEDVLGISHRFQTQRLGPLASLAGRRHASGALEGALPREQNAEALHRQGDAGQQHRHDEQQHIQRPVAMDHVPLLQRRPGLRLAPALAAADEAEHRPDAALAISVAVMQHRQHSAAAVLQGQDVLAPQGNAAVGLHLQAVAEAQGLRQHLLGEVAVLGPHQETVLGQQHRLTCPSGAALRHERQAGVAQHELSQRRLHVGGLGLTFRDEEGRDEHGRAAELRLAQLVEQHIDAVDLLAALDALRVRHHARGLSRGHERRQNKGRRGRLPHQPAARRRLRAALAAAGLRLLHRWRTGAFGGRLGDHKQSETRR